MISAFPRRSVPPQPTTHASCSSALNSRLTNFSRPSAFPTISAAARPVISSRGKKYLRDKIYVSYAVMPSDGGGRFDALSDGVLQPSKRLTWTSAGFKANGHSCKFLYTQKTSDASTVSEIFVLARNTLLRSARDRRYIIFLTVMFLRMTRAVYALCGSLSRSDKGCAEIVAA